jgi:hypothetical protein
VRPRRKLEIVSAANEHVDMVRHDDISSDRDVSLGEPSQREVSKCSMDSIVGKDALPVFRAESNEIQWWLITLVDYAQPRRTTL